jgi:hypothetical protein
LEMKNKKSLIALIFVVVLTVSTMVQLEQVSGQTDVPDYLYVLVSPNPVGVGQTVYISLFFTKPIPSNATPAAPASLFYNLMLNIANPDGTNTTLGPYTTDTTGGVGAVPFVPKATGNYTVQATYPGQIIKPTGGQLYHIVPSMSPAVVLVVQTAQIPTYSSPPLPTNYWTRPIYASNYGWAQTIGGNWYGLGRPGFDNTGGYDGSGNNFQPYSTAPTTAHVLWTKPTQPGGQPGGETTPDQMSAYVASSPLYHFLEPIILNGVLYYNWYPAQTDKAYIVAVDLHTGQTLWVQNTNDTLIYGQVIKVHNVEEFGSQALLWASTTTSSTWHILDPMTGAYMASVTGVTSGAFGFATSTIALIDAPEPQCEGSILIYSTSGGNITMWNSSYLLSNQVSGGLAAEMATGNYKPTGSYNYSKGIMWSVKLPSSGLGIAAETHDAILLASYPSALTTFATQYGGAYATEAAIDPITGALLWGPTNHTLTKFDELDLAAAGDGVYVRHDKDTNQVYGYSLTNGSQLWGPTQLVGNALSTVYGQSAIAYGLYYYNDLGGYVNAVNLTTGALKWTYTRGSAGYNTPYGVYPTWVFDTQTIADGMYFVSEGRCYDPPLFPGGKKLAINVTDGTLVWAISGAFQRDPCPIADGIQVGWNGYDGQIYAFGKGPSKTTVTAPNIGVTTATPVTITGTVTDISAGVSQEAVAKNFPNGLPCVSDASMEGWMEFVYEQQPCPATVTGVPVSLWVLDSNNNYRQIGSATTDGSGTYALTWTPDIPGNFTVVATFAGSASYYPSNAEAHFYASSPPSTPAPVQYPVPIDYTMTIAVAAIVIIIAIAIVGFLILRKHP